MTSTRALMRLSGALLLAVLVSGTAATSSAQQASAPNRTESSSDVLVAPKDCQSLQCTTKRQVYDAFDIILDRNTPNLGAYLHPERFNPRKFLADHERDLRRLLNANRVRWPLFCEDVTQVAAHYNERDYEWGYVAVELAGRLSSSSLDCAAQVIEIFPSVPEVESMLAKAAEDCHRDRHPGCKYIDRAITTRNARLAP
jgi:hypothetical protein